MMFKNVLLDLGSTVDGRLVAHVADFCRKADAELTVLNVFEEPSRSVSSYFSAHHKDLQNIILENYGEQLDNALSDSGLDAQAFTREVRWGKDFIEAIKLVHERKFDLLISASQENAGPPDSTAMHLMRKSPCPVWIHRGDLWKGAVRVLAAVNTSDTSDENRRLNAKIIRHGMHVNNILRGHLHIISCWSGYMESVLSSPRFSEQEKVDYLDFEQKQTEQELAALVKAEGVPDTAKTKIIHGSPAQVIPRYAAEQKMDVVVMGSVARTGIPGLLVGNTAEKIVANLDNSILAIKPDGFVSPVSG
ncbi:universal stress protein [Pseudodesulfovibrio profundus]|nr:universal stress protein [Pseudodesulfovibrio profundus]